MVLYMRRKAVSRSRLSSLRSAFSFHRSRNRALTHIDTTVIRVARRIAYIPLGRDARGGYAKVDVRDVAIVRPYRWHRYTQRRQWKTYYYAMARIESRRDSPVVFMHRLLIPTEVDVDHKDGDGLDNRRRNLRAAKSSDNTHNQVLRCTSTTGFKGVAVVVDRKRRPYAWKAHICVNYKKSHLGCFRTPEAAARAYDRAARKNFGAFACTNFPRRGERNALKGTYAFEEETDAKSTTAP